MRNSVFILLAAASIASAQRATLDLRRVHTMVDQDGRGFAGLPRYLVALPKARFLVMDDRPNSAPAILDSTGRVIRPLGVLGEGPGELGYFSGPFRVGGGDSVVVLTGERMYLYTPDLRFVRALRPSSIPDDLVLTPAGFIATRAQPTADKAWIPFHVLDRSGKSVRSFGRDTGQRPVAYRLASSTGGAVWALPRMEHRFERWSSVGTQVQVIDFVPKWWKQIKTNGRQDPFSVVRDFREVDGVLWVLSMVPVKDIREIMKAAGQKNPVTEGNAPRLPMEKMYTTTLEAYDVRTGKQLAEASMPGAPVTIIDDGHFVVYSVTDDDLPRLQFWEMKLKR